MDSYANIKAYDLVVVGGGAAGFMASISASDEGFENICILEGTSKTLEKVRISGGGRCNLTNSVWDNKDLVTNYPRGRKALLSPFSRFSTFQAFSWFEEKGLELKIEDDGRIFPASNSSKDVIQCLLNNAIQLGVNIEKNKYVTGIEKLDNGLYLTHIKDTHPILSKNVLLATGGSPSGRKLASRLGHTVINSVPSLFSFTFSNQILKSCADFLQSC